MIKTIIKFLALSLCLLIGFYFLRFWRSYQVSHLMNSQVNLVLSSQESMLVAAFNFEEEKINLVELPQTLYFSEPEGLGDYPIASVYDLGEIEGKGGELLLASLRKLLAIPLDGFIRKEDFGKIGQDNLKGFIREAMMKLGRSGFKTDLAFWELIFLNWRIKNLACSEADYFNLGETKVLKEKELPDKTKVYEAEEADLDILMRKIFAERKIEEEGIEMEILNATEESGLAFQLARLIKNMGGRVVSLGNSEEAFDHSVIRYTEEAGETATLKRIGEATVFELEKRDDLGESRSEIQIIVGKDYGKIR